MPRPDRFAACVAEVLLHEGGYADHPRDPGGCTNRGITRRTLEGWRREPVSCQHVRALTEAEARAIYRAHYWNALHGDELPVGPRTLRVACGANDRSAVITRACDLRLDFLRGLDTWPDFGRGWSRRVREVRAAALGMAGA